MDGCVYPTQPFRLDRYSVLMCKAGDERRCKKHSDKKGEARIVTKRTIFFPKYSSLDGIRYSLRSPLVPLFGKAQREGKKKGEPRRRFYYHTPSFSLLRIFFCSMLLFCYFPFLFVILFVGREFWMKGTQRRVTPARSSREGWERCPSLPPARAARTRKGGMRRVFPTYRSRLRRLPRTPRSCWESLG